METVTQVRAPNKASRTRQSKLSKHTRQLLKLLRRPCWCWLMPPLNTGLGPVRVTKREMREYVRWYGDRLHYQLSPDGQRLTLEPMPW